MSREIDYDRLLANFRAGDWAMVTLQAGDDGPTVQRELQEAAKRRGLTLIVIVRRPSWFRFRLEACEEISG